MLQVKCPDFYQEKQYHRCRFCSVDIKTLDTNTGKLRANNLFRMVTIPLRDGSKYRFNGCKNCCRQVSKKNFMMIARSDPAMRIYNAKSATRPKINGWKAKVLKIEKAY